MRVLGILTLLLCFASGGFSIFALSDASRMAETLSLVAASFEQQIDSAVWRQHWVAYELTIMSFSIVGMVAGAGLVARRRWGLLLWAILVTAALTARLLQGAFFAKYAFEVVEPAELAFWTVLAVLSWAFYFRRRHASRAPLRAAVGPDTKPATEQSRRDA